MKVLWNVFIFGFLVKVFIPLAASLSTEGIHGMYAVTSQVSTLGTGSSEPPSTKGFQGSPYP